MKQKQRILLVLPLLLAVGCDPSCLARLFPNDVGVGAARLSVRNAAGLLALVSSDERCGFSSSVVKSTPTIVGQVGGLGTVTFNVQDCDIDLAEATTISSDCLGDELQVNGKVRVSGTRVIEGRITGNTETPVVPLKPNAVTITVDAALTNFYAAYKGDVTSLTVREGRIAFTAAPHLAVSSANDVCSLPDNNVTITNLVLTNALSTLDDGEQAFDVDIGTSNLTAQIGKWQDLENFLEGSISVWEIEVPVPGTDQGGLDPEYDAVKHVESFACTENLVLPVSYNCPDFNTRVVDGIAQLIIKAFGNAVSLVDKNTTCGFTSPDVKNNPELIGEIGLAGGHARYELDEECAIDFPAETVVTTDCVGKTTSIEGGFSATGTKIVRGFRTGEDANPIIPLSRDPATISLTVDAANYIVRTSDTTNYLKIISGTLSGTMRPRTGIDAATGVCSMTTPVIEFENIALTDAVIELSANGSIYRYRATNTEVDAQNGKKGDVENYLSGRLFLDEVEYSVPSGTNPPVLSPTYDPESFLGTYSCLENLVVPESDEECTIAPLVAEGAARLLVQSAGVLATLINADEVCGFESTDVKIFPYLVDGDPGEVGRMDWKLDNCTVGGGGGNGFILSSNCVGADTWVAGSATISADRTVRGVRENIVLGFEPFSFPSIVPNARNSVDIFLRNAVLNEFRVTAYGANGAAPKGVLTIHSGRVVGLVQPILGERADEAGTFDIPTPVAKLTNIRLINAKATLVSEGRTYQVLVGDALISAQNGTYGTASNTISGTIRIDGTTIDIGALNLDPDFEQAAFDQTYACTPNLMEVIPVDE